MDFHQICTEYRTSSDELYEIYEPEFKTIDEQMKECQELLDLMQETQAFLRNLKPSRRNRSRRHKLAKQKQTVDAKISELTTVLNILIHERKCLDYKYHKESEIIAETANTQQDIRRKNPCRGRRPSNEFMQFEAHWFSYDRWWNI